VTDDDRQPDNRDQGDVSKERDDAHEVALELMKQLIALASGVLALSATFLEKFVPLAPYRLVVLVLAWLLLAFSIFFGLETISAIVQSRLNDGADWSLGYGYKCAKAAKYLFVAGICLFAVFALLSAHRSTESPSPTIIYWRQ
jgi:hypothetical protein